MFAHHLKELLKSIPLDTVTDTVDKVLRESDDQVNRARQNWLEHSITFSDSGYLPWYTANPEQFKEGLFLDQNNEDENIINVIYCITNNTHQQLKLASTNTNLKAAPSHVKLLPAYQTTYFCERTLTNFKGIDSIRPNNRVHADRFFIYVNHVGDCVFLIETDFKLKTKSGYHTSDIKAWNHKIASVGHTPVECTSTLEHSLEEAPYSYLLNIQIG
ncbi:hypothetical protein [Pseudomonas purpurea]|uniref:hypothetical protein n=1 Tax=Pseudomonas purpurea TaxID=3136737 RepID=UPI003267827F